MKCQGRLWYIVLGLVMTSDITHLYLLFIMCCPLFETIITHASCLMTDSHIHFALSCWECSLGLIIRIYILSSYVCVDSVPSVPMYGINIYCIADTTNDFTWGFGIPIPGILHNIRLLLKMLVEKLSETVCLIRSDLIQDCSFKANPVICCYYYTAN